MDKFRAAVRRLSEELEPKSPGGSLLTQDHLKEQSEEEETAQVGPLVALLGDACRLAGFSYAEVWVRKNQEDVVIDVNAKNRPGRRLQPGEIEMKPIDDSMRASMESQTKTSLEASRRPYNRGESVELGDLPDEGTGRKSFKLQRAAISYDGVGPPPAASSEAPGQSDIFERARSNFGKSVKDLHKKLSPEITVERDPPPRPSNETMANQLTFSGHSFFHRLKFQRDPQLGSELQELITEMQNHYADHKMDIGQGLAGHCWSRAPAVDIQDVSKFHLDNEEQDRRVHEDPHTDKVAEAFDFSYGVPVMDSQTHSHVIAVVVLYHFKGEAVSREDLENPAIHGVLLHIAGMVPLALELEQLLPEFRTAASDVNAKRVLEHRKENDEKPHELMTWERYKTKFMGVPGAKPQAGNDAAFSAFAAAGSFIAIVSVTATDDAVKLRDSEMFALVGSFGAVAALLFAAPQSPVSQPRNIVFGHILCCVIAILVDYFTNPRYLPLLPQWFANALAPALGIAAMSYTGWTHPPAAACATVYISGDLSVKNLHWLYILFPVLYDCFVMIGLAVLLNNVIPSRQYPMLW